MLKAIDKIDSKLNETPESEKSNEWKANKSIIESILPKLKEVSDLNLKELEISKKEANELSKVCKEFAESDLKGSSLIKNADIVDDIIEDVMNERKATVDKSYKLISDAMEKGELNEIDAGVLLEALEEMKTFIPKSISGNKEKKLLDEIIDDLKGSIESGTKAKLDKTVCEQLKAIATKSDKRLNNSDEDSNKILEALKCLFDEEEPDKETLLNTNDIENLLTGIKVAKEALKNELNEPKLIELEDILLHKLEDSKDLMKLDSSISEPLMNILCEAVQIQSSIPDIAERITKCRKEEEEQSRKPIESILKDLLENSKTDQIKLKGHNLNKISKAIDKIDSKLNETPESEKSIEWKRNKSIIESILPNLIDILHSNQKSFYISFENATVLCNILFQYFPSLDNSEDDVSNYHPDFVIPQFIHPNFYSKFSSFSSNQSLFDEKRNSEDLQYVDSFSQLRQEYASSLAGSDLSSEIGYNADSSFSAQFNSSDLPLYSPGSDEVFDPDRNLDVNINKPNNWVQFFEMELKYLEGQTDSFISSFNRLPDSSNPNYENNSENTDFQKIAEDAKARIVNLEKYCANYVSSRRSSNSFLSNVSSRQNSRDENSMPQDLQIMFEAIKKKNNAILNSSSLTRHDTEKFIQDQTRNIFQIKNQLLKSFHHTSSSMKKLNSNDSDLEKKQPISTWKRFKEKHNKPTQPFRSISQLKSSPLSQSFQSLNRKSNFDIEKSKKLLEETKKIIHSSKEKLNEN